MSTTLTERQAPPAPGRRGGGGPARRAVIRWAWRLFRREWRQQLLILALVIVAVAATVVGAAVAVNTPSPANAGFGTAHDRATYQMPDPRLASQLASLRSRFGRVQVIENQAIAIPGSVSTFSLRAQGPRGPFGQPMLSLLSGHYPAGPGQAAVTRGVAAAFHLRISSVWHEAGKAWRVTGIVQNPQDTLDEFALVLPGQVRAPTEVTALFDAPGVAPSKIGSNVETTSTAANHNVLNPEFFSYAAVTLGMLLIALVGVGGFTVLAQRRLRSIGMLGAQGATDRNTRLVVRANGVIVGVAGALAGFVLGLVAWLAYRPQVEAGSHHLIGMFQLPWPVIGAAMLLAVLATYYAARRPARSIARVPIVTALAGRPAPPKAVSRLALPTGIGFLVLAFILLGVAGGANYGGGLGEAVLGLVAAAVAVVLLAPSCLTLLARIGRHAPIGIRLALRDLARYRARSGSTLGAISLAVLAAVIICVLAAGRYGGIGGTLDYAGPNLASSQLLVNVPNTGPGSGPVHAGHNSHRSLTRHAPAGTGTVTGSKLASLAAKARGIAAALGSHDIVRLEQTSATLQRAASGRNWDGPIYVATPQLLRAFGIKPSQVSPRADILTMRPGLSGISKMQLIYGNYLNPNAPHPNGHGSFPCPRGSCLASPVIQEVSALPSGTSAPNTVITEHAVRKLGLRSSTAGWLIQAPHPLTAAQISSARLAAAAAGMAIETRNSVPGLSEIVNAATVFGIVLALGILAMSVGLIRSETASDLRTLAATGASGATRRTITAATAGGLGLLGAVLGTACGYVAVIGFWRTSQIDGLSSLTSVPVANLLLILVGMPLFAAAVAWLLAWREPPGMARQPLE